jgi:beta-glucosidase
MKTHSFPLRNIALAMLVGLAAHAHAQQNSVEERVEGILNKMTLDEKLAYISGVGFDFATFGTYPGVFNIKGDERLSTELGYTVNLGLPEIYGSDGSIGLTGQGTPPGTRYPSALLLASTWNAERAYKEGLALGREARARGIHRILGPGVNFYRTSFNGRSSEYMTGEDPFLGAVLATAQVKGIQSQGVMATTKHLVANDEEVNRAFINVIADERTLREIYLPPFEAAVKIADTAAIMTAFNKINGDFAAESHFLITEVLKQDWGFRGFVESDFGATHDGLEAAKAGLDIEMPGGLTIVDNTPFTLQFEGQMTRDKLRPFVDEFDLDDKVRRLLRGIVAYGFLDRPQLDSSIPVNGPRSKKEAIDLAREGIVLLENKKNFLPLNRSRIKKIAVIGGNAKGVPPTVGLGGSAIVPVPPSTDFTSEIDGIKSLLKKDATVDYLEELVPDPSTAEWQTKSGDQGLDGQYFPNPDFTGTPVERVDKHLNFTNFNTTPPATPPGVDPSSFSGIWTGKMTPKISGDHVFKVFLPRKIRVWVNNQKIIDNTEPVFTPDTPISATSPYVRLSGKIFLRAGESYDVRIEASFGGGGAFEPIGLQASWASLQPRADLAKYDAVVLAVGGNGQYDGEGQDRSFRLPEFQDDLILNATKLNPNTIVVLHGGGGFNVQAWVDKVAALLHAWFPGQYGGQALAEILFGEVSPSGKLPITMEKRVEDNPAFATFPLDDLDAPEIHKEAAEDQGLFVGYRGYEKNRIKPQYPFGYGLSYTKFKYSDLEVDPRLLRSNFGEDDVVRVSFKVRNSGGRAGSEIAQLYVAPVNPPVERPLKELKGFKKVFLKPGESKKITIELDRRSLAYYNVETDTWDAARGLYRILVASSSQDIQLQTALVNAVNASLSVTDSTPVPGATKADQASSSSNGNARVGTAAVGGSTLMVNDGSGSGGYDLGAIVTVTADPPPPGKEFSGWSGDTQILANPSEETTTATIPSIDVTITATYADIPSGEQP